MCHKIEFVIAHHTLRYLDVAIQMSHFDKLDIDSQSIVFNHLNLDDRWNLVKSEILDPSFSILIAQEFRNRLKYPIHLCSYTYGYFSDLQFYKLRVYNSYDEFMNAFSLNFDGDAFGGEILTEKYKKKLLYLKEQCAFASMECIVDLINNLKLHTISYKIFYNDDISKLIDFLQNL